jgi:hypothetical protein
MISEVIDYWIIRLRESFAEVLDAGFVPGLWDLSWALIDGDGSAGGPGLTPGRKRA